MLGHGGCGRLDRRGLLGVFSGRLFLLAFAGALARVASVGVECRVRMTGAAVFALHVLEREQRAALREGDPGHEGDQVGGRLVLLGEAIEAMDHHLSVINRGAKIRKPIRERLDLLKIVGHGHLAHLDITELGHEVELAIDLVVVEEVGDAVLELDSERIITGRHDGVEDADRDRPIEPRDDGGVEERPLRCRGSGGSDVEVI